MSAAIVWFREDLRLADNPALTAAVDSGAPVLPVYIDDPKVSCGAASAVWQRQALRSLAQDLEGIGLPLVWFRGAPETMLPALVSGTSATHVFWNRRYTQTDIATDSALKKTLSAAANVRSFASRLMHEPFDIANKSGKPFLVFTPFYKHCRALFAAGDPLPAPAQARGFDWDPVGPLAETLAGIRVDAGFQPDRDAPAWAQGIAAHWAISETGGHARLQAFADDAVTRYAEARDRPAQAGVSGLAPYLHAGMLTPRQVWAAVYGDSAAPGPAGGPGDAGREAFTRQLFWRDFAHHLLFHFPHTPERALKAQWDAFPWLDAPVHLEAWQAGRTGYPFVDAGMRELWATGYMHNRVRMVVGSFLTKHLGLDWRAGAAWFNDTLFDADLANNTLGWQWVAGCGADAAPYFRIFNPTAQGEKFDPQGDYIRRWVPELAELPSPWLHAPADAPRDVLVRAGVRIGETYPAPIVEHKAARQAALDRYEAIKK